MASPAHDNRARGGRPGQARLYRILFLVYGVLTVLTFLVLRRYMIYLARYWDYDIRNAALQWSLYFGILVFATLAAYGALRLMRLPLTREGVLRTAFAAGVTLSAIIAWYQSQHGMAKLVNYFTVGTLGSFAAALIATRRELGLVEVIARPAPEVLVEVEGRHRGLALAATPGDRLKRGLDFAISLAIVVVSLPISILLALAVWLQDPGPLLVAKVAVKRGGRSFNQLKLRSMVKNAEGRTGPVPASPSDARVTRLGNLLRRSHVDELPQMLNILRGEMSLVGPRPERTVFVQRHLATIPRYRERHAVRPGLAGLAQVYGDYYSTPREKLGYDLLYIRRRSLWLDLRLFGAAVVLALSGVPPRRRRGGRSLGGAELRWQRAYRALRGEAPVEPVAPAPAASAGSPGAEASPSGAAGREQEPAAARPPAAGGG